MPRSYLFVGGPVDGQRFYTHGEPVFKIPVQDEDLSTMLQASIDVLEKGVAPLPAVKIARYEYGLRRSGDGLLLFDGRAYRFAGWE